MPYPFPGCFAGASYPERPASSAVAVSETVFNRTGNEGHLRRDRRRGGLGFRVRSGTYATMMPPSRDPSLPLNRRSRMVDPNEQAVVVVRGRGDGFAQEITAGRHRLIADEPVSAGGTDRGLGPYDLLLAGLGA